MANFLRSAFVVLAIGVSAFAQISNSKSSRFADSGLYDYTSASLGHDSSAGWSGQMDSAVGYDFSQNLAVEMGAPFYIVSTAPATNTSGTTTSATHTGSVGDVFVRMKGQVKSDALKYAATLTGTAPTGDTSTGVSTGRATVNWNNRLEHGLDRVTPFGEASLGNSLHSTRRVHRNYTTLGAISEFRGGMGFDLVKTLSVEASGYADVGYGNQKIYSHSVKRGTTGLGGVKHNRAFDVAYLTTGSSSLVNDRGFTADLSWNITPRFETEFAYNRSLHFSSNSLAVSVGVRLGHCNNPKAAEKN